MGEAMSQATDEPQELKIVLNPSSRAEQVYYPGSEVTGTVFVKLDTPQRYNNIAVHLLGKRYVRWTHRTTHSGGNGPSYVSFDRREAEELYVDLTKNLWSKRDAPGGVLPAGRHGFEFHVMIPQGAPSSHESTTRRIDNDKGSGCTEYTLTAHVVRIHPSPDHVSSSKKVAVKEIVDINTPNLLVPYTRSIHKPAGYYHCTSGSITATLELPKTGFYVGEDVSYRLTVENGGIFSVNVSAILEEHLIYYARFRKTKCRPAPHCTLCDGPLRPHETTVLTPDVQAFTIPSSVEATMSSRITKQWFTLTVTIDRARRLFKRIQIMCPITISNMPPTSSSTGVNQQPIPPQLIPYTSAPPS